MTGACDPCLRRAWLYSSLAAHIEIARRRRRPLRDILSLGDGDLMRAVAGPRHGEVARALERVEPAALRAEAGAAGLTALCRHADAYPERLREDRSAPAVLFLLGGDDPVGRLAGLTGRTGGEPVTAVAIVGTRRASAAGEEVARALGRGLSAAGVTVVSGMALGIDSAAHAGALEGGGRTIAVLAGSAHEPYPRSKRTLHGALAAHGLVVSEMPPGAAVHRWSFPARNRVIAALAAATIVVEAAERSGSLITAELALDLGRDVGAVPGPVLSWRSGGTNALLRDGATLIRDARDVLDLVLGADAAAATAGAACRAGGTQARPAGLEPRLDRLLDRIEAGDDTVAALAASPAEADEIAAALTELELRGLLRRGPGGRYVRAAA